MAKKTVKKKSVNVSPQTPKKIGFVEYTPRDQEIANRIAARNKLLEDLNKPKRARTKKGKLIADDPATKEVNEAWEGGKAPKKKNK